MNRSDSLAKKMVLATVLALGAVVVNTLGWGIITTVLDPVLSGDRTSEYLQVQMNGEVIRNISSSSGRYLERRTLAGATLEVDEAEHRRLTAEGSSVGWVRPQAARGDWLPTFPPTEPTVWDRTYWYVRQPSPGSSRFYLEGFSGVTYRSTGCLSRAGFSSTRPADSEMWEILNDLPRYWGNAHEGRLSGREFIAAKDGIWRLDFRSLNTDLILPGITTASVGQIILNPDWLKTAGKPRVGLLVRQEQAILIFDAETLKPQELPLKPEYREAHVTLYALTEDRLLLMASTTKDETDLQWFAPDGKVTREERVTLQRPQSLFNSPPPVVAGMMVAVVFPCPALIGAALTVETVMSWARGGDSSQSNANDRQTALFASLGLALMSALSAWLCSRHAKRYHVRHRTAWVLFTLAFGPAGLIGYWSHRSWPVLAVSEWVTAGTPTPPAPKGIEVFA